MRNVVSLKTYIESYNVTKDDVMNVINSDRTFFDKYIEWGENDSETILSPKAINRLGESFNAEKTPSGQLRMEDVMTAPVTESTEEFETQTEASDPLLKSPEEKKKRKRTSSEEKAPRKRKSKNSITKQFIADHGRCSSGNTKDLRMLLMSSGLYKAEQVALMNDDEVLDVVSKDYYFIGAEEGTYIIKRSALISIAGDVCFIGKEAQ